MYLRSSEYNCRGIVHLQNEGHNLFYLNEIILFENLVFNIEETTYQHRHYQERQFDSPYFDRASPERVMTNLYWARRKKAHEFINQYKLIKIIKKIFSYFFRRKLYAST